MTEPDPSTPSKLNVSSTKSVLTRSSSKKSTGTLDPISASSSASDKLADDDDDEEVSSLVHSESEESVQVTEPVQRKTRAHKIRVFLYNKEEDSYCGRTCASWCKIIAYYIGFLFFVIGLLTCFIYYTSIKDSSGRPLYKKEELFDGISPGATFLPTDETRSKSVMWYTFKGSDSPENRRAGGYVRTITSFLSKQEQLCQAARDNGEVCTFNRTAFGPCSVSDYGYGNKKPCIFIMLNKLAKWFPSKYLDVQEIPSNIPDSIRSVIVLNRGCIWLHCEGNSVADKSYLGKIAYYPEQAFHENHFPYLKGVEVNPVVAIKLENIKPGYVISLTCMLIAKNVHESTKKIQTIIYLDLE